MDLRFFNTLSRSVEKLPPRDAPIRLYTCGPTVYNYLHVGNYRTYIFEDILKRTLKALGFKVRHVMNITDVGHLTDDADEGEDKLELGAAREGKTAWDIAGFYADTFRRDIQALNIDFKPVKAPKRAYEPEAADIECRATEHIEEQERMVDRLIEAGYTYETSDGIYFDTSKFKGYGALAGGAHMAGLQEGARVRVNTEKRNSTDFALWKFSPKGKKRQMEWEYRGRPGFPGWHIECSSMGQTYLGETLDIHCGGVDHIPIHHTNEIAQAEALVPEAERKARPFSRFWMHAEFLLMHSAKMAKSAGGFVTLGDLVKKGFDPLDYRYFCYSAHYRKQLDFSWEALEAARTGRRRLREHVLTLMREAKGTGTPTPEVEARIEAFLGCLADDLNMPKALGVLHDALSALGSAGEKLALLEKADAVLALRLTEPAEDSLPEELQALFERYAAAKKAKDYAVSDQLRKELAGKGIKVKDTREGSFWERV